MERLPFVRKDREVRIGDFVFGDRHRIGVIVRGVAELVAANVGDDMYAVHLHAQRIAMHVTDIDFLVRWEIIEEIAHHVAERIQVTPGLDEQDYKAAAKLLNESEPAFYANSLFRNPVTQGIHRIFEEVVEEKYPEGPRAVYEIMQVAYLAIFSEYLPEK